MSDSTVKRVNAREFGCGAPLKFYERCSACPRFEQGCPDLLRGLALLQGKKICYDEHIDPGDDMVHVSSFGCLAPVRYYQKTRETCAHRGRCREEGLLLALLTGKRTMEYARRAPVRMTFTGRRDRDVEGRESDREAM